MDWGSCVKMIPILPMMVNGLFTQVNSKIIPHVNNDSNIENTLIKSDEELLKYVSCYQTNAELTDKFRKTYWPKIKEASRISGVPTAVLTCLLFRESSQWQNKTSPSGAIGIAQFKPNTKNFIDSMIQAKPYSIDQTNVIANNIQTFTNKNKNYISKELKDFEKMIRNNEIGLNTIEQKIQRLEALKYLSTKTMFKNPEYFEMTRNIEGWIADLEKTKSKLIGNNIWNEFYKNSKNKPTALNVNSVNQSIIASAMYVNYLHSKVSEVNSNHKVTQFDSYLYAVGSYNDGLAGLDKDCDFDKPIQSCLQKIKKKDAETYNHIVSMQNCMKPKSFEPMVDTQKRSCP